MAALYVSPPPAVPFSQEGRGGENALVAPTRPLGGGVGPAPLVPRRSPSSPLARRPPRDGGGGRLISLAPAPPPWGGGVCDPLGGGQCPPMSLRTPPGLPSASRRCPRKYPPALGREGGDDAIVRPPTRVCPSGCPAGACDACSRSPCAPPCPAVPPGGSGEGGKGCLSPPRSFNIPEPLRLCPPPPGDAWGGLRAPPGVARTRALLGVLIA